MREVISLHLGQCGNQIASSFWTKISKEHEISPQGVYVGNQPDLELRYGRVFFREVSEGKYVPRAILIDTEPSAVQSALAKNSFNDFYAPQNIILLNGSGAANSWATGYELGSTMAGIGLEVFDAIHAEVEACDSLQGFQMTHSLGGGTGSGFGSWLYEALRDELPGIIFTSYSVGQSAVSSVVVEPYNSVLSLNTLQEDVDGVHLFDNDSLAKLCSEKLEIPNPTFENLNDLISDVMSGMTASLRFPGQHNTSLRKQMTNLMPDPKYHLFMCSQSPLRSGKNLPTNMVSQIHGNELATDVFKPQNMMLSSVCRRSEKILAASAMFRGKVSTREIEDAMSQLQMKDRYRFVDYLANSIQTSVCNIPPPGLPLSATCVINSSLVSDSLRDTLDTSRALFIKQAYLHYYNNTVCDSKCIQESLDAMEVVYRNYSDLECFAPSEEPLRKPRAMGPNQLLRQQSGGYHSYPNSREQHNKSFRSQTFIDGQSTTTNSSHQSWREGHMDQECQ